MVSCIGVWCVTGLLSLALVVFLYVVVPVLTFFSINLSFLVKLLCVICVLFFEWCFCVFLLFVLLFLVLLSLLSW